MCRLSWMGRILASVLFAAGTIAAQTFTQNGFSIPDATIDDPASCATFNISGLTGQRVVRSVSFLSLQHTFVGDLEFVVWPPGSSFGNTGFVQLAFPPGDRACNYNGNYRFTDLAAQTIDAATTGPCADGFNLPAGNYRSSTAAVEVPVGSGNWIPGTPTSVPAIFGGALSGAQLNGTWLVCINDDASADVGSVGPIITPGPPPTFGPGVSITFSAPTAATVSVSGRTTFNGAKALAGTTVRIFDSSGNSRTTTTNSEGNYSFDDVEAGAIYTVGVVNKGYTFNPSTVVVPVDDNVANLNFSGSKPRRR